MSNQAPQSIEFFRQEYWSGLSFPSPDLPNPGIEPGSPALQADSLPTEPPGNRNRNRVHNKWTALETPQNLPPLLSVKKLSSRKTPKVKEGTSSVLSCPRLLASGDAEAGVSQEAEPPLCGVLNRPPIALVMIGEICFIFKKYPCGINLKLSNSLTVFLIKSFLSLLICEVPTVTIRVLIYLIVLLTLWI